MKNIIVKGEIIDKFLFFDDNNTMKNYIKYYTPLGDLYIVEESGQLLNITFDKRSNWLHERVSNHQYHPEVIKETCRFLNKYFNGQNVKVDLPIKLEGSEFFKTVLDECLKIPYGRVVSYKELGDRVKERLNMANISYQAIGQALKKNPILIYIPCHRVVGINGDIKGYAYGDKIKKELLKMEGIDLKGDKLW